MLLFGAICGDPAGGEAYPCASQRSRSVFLAMTLVSIYDQKCILSRANFRIRGHDSVCSSAAPFALTARVDRTTLTIDRPRARARIRERAIR